MSNQLKKAEQLATQAHAGQFRRDGKTPYINHPRDVVSRVEDIDAKIVAWLHDVLEDTDVTEEALYDSGFTYPQIHAIKLLTKQPGQSYDDYLDYITMSNIARRVKIADMQSNLADDPTERQIEKYSAGLDKLNTKHSYDMYFWKNGKYYNRIIRATDIEQATEKLNDIYDGIDRLQNWGRK